MELTNSGIPIICPDDKKATETLALSIEAQIKDYDSEKSQEGSSNIVIIDLKNITDIEPIEPGFKRRLNAMAANSDKKIILITPSLRLRSRLIGLGLNEKIDLCGSLEQAENEIAERLADIDELKRRMRREYYSR